jgi:hypothetical protein
MRYRSRRFAVVLEVLRQAGVMPISADILDRRTAGFVLWCPRPQAAAPQLVVGRLVPGNPPTLAGVRRIALAPVADLAVVVHGCCGGVRARRRCGLPLLVRGR